MQPHGTVYLIGPYDSDMGSLTMSEALAQSDDASKDASRAA